MQAILILSPDWRTRALLAAQLGEMSDYKVASAQSVNQALSLIKLGGIDPVLMVFDVDQQVPRSEIERAIAALPHTPLVLIVSALRRTALASLKEDCAAYLVRPIRIGEVAQKAIQTLKDENGQPELDRQNS